MLTEFTYSYSHTETAGGSEDTTAYGIGIFAVLSLTDESIKPYVGGRYELFSGKEFDASSQSFQSFDGAITSPTLGIAYHIDAKFALAVETGFLVSSREYSAFRVDFIGTFSRLMGRVYF